MSFSVISLLNPDLLQLGVRSLIEGIDKSIIQPEITEEDVAMAVARIRPNILVVGEDLFSNSCMESILRACFCYNILIVCMYNEKPRSLVEGVEYLGVQQQLPELQQRFEALISDKRASIGDDATEELTIREKDIIRDVALGLSSKEIADKNFISPHTVVTHRKNISRKLGIKSISGLTIYAIINKLVSVDDIRDSEHG